MNPFEWEDVIERLRRNQDPNHQAIDNSTVENASRSHNDWDTPCQYSRYTVDKPRNRVLGVNFGSEELNAPSHTFYMKDSEVKDPDGELFEMDSDDPELTRKRKELREIEEQIMCKKVAIALKTVKPIVQTSPAFPSNKHSDTCNSASLKDRVKVILQQRHPVSFLSKVSNRFNDH